MVLGEGNIVSIRLPIPPFTLYVTEIIYWYKYTYLFSKCLISHSGASEMGYFFMCSQRI